MLIGVISDTHGHVPYTRAAVWMLASLEVEAVLHCGDIGSVEIVPLVAEWPAHFVFGNVDYNEAELRAAIEAVGQTCHGRFGAVELGGRRIAILHGDDTRRLSETIAGGDFDLVCSGHTHVASQRKRGPTLALNPGALYRARPHTLAIVDLQTMEATSVVVSDGE